MARPSRIDLQGYYYHVMSRGQRKNPIFFSPRDRVKYFLIINELLSETDIKICSYCLMSNHVHLLIHRNRYPLQTFMKRLNTKYAIYFNKKYNLVGHVFQGRYVSKIVLNINYLTSIVKYIHINPVKASIVQKPGEYEYSSAKFYEGKKEDNILNIEKIDIFKSVKKYMEFMNSEYIEYPIFRDCIGSKKDYLSLEKRMSYKEKSKFNERRKSTQNIYKDASIISQEFGYKIEDILASKWKRNKKRTKIQIIKELIEYGYSYSEIARFFGYSNSTISKILKNKI